MVKENSDPKKTDPVKADPTKKTDPGYVTKSDFEKFMVRIGQQFEKVTSLIVETKESFVHGESLTDSDPITNFGDPGPVEKVSETNFVEVAELEAFMNQKLLININLSGNKEDLPVLLPNINGINHPILRGVDTWVKRKFVEVLARTRLTRYEQRIPDPMHPDKFVMDRHTSVKDPFIVKKDPHKFGRNWLEGILREAA
jgi:hypothetical protein